MALANFFDRAAMAASQILAGFDRAAFAATLERHVIGIALDGNAVQTAEGRATVDMVVRLISRLYPAISFLPVDAQAEAAIAEAVTLARSINPGIDVKESAAITICVAVGLTAPAIGRPTLFAGSDG